VQAHGKWLFTGIENVKGRFLLDIASVHEIEYPFRKCNRALYIHAWPGVALVLGIWKKKTKTTDEHLIEALKGRIIDLQKQNLFSKSEEI
jgi:phage-related protein